MTNVSVVEKNAEIDGKPIRWTVLAIVGSIGGETQTLELKVNKTEAMLAKLLLNSKEEITTSSRRASGEELDEFFKQNSGRSSSNKIDLSED